MLQTIHSIYLRLLRSMLLLLLIQFRGFSADSCAPSFAVNILLHLAKSVGGFPLLFKQGGSHSAVWSQHIKHPQPNCLMPRFLKKTFPLNERFLNTQTSCWSNGTTRLFFFPTYLVSWWRGGDDTGNSDPCQILKLAAFFRWNHAR